LIHLSFKPSNFYYIYSRKSIGFSGLFAKIGGSLASFKILGGILAGIFSKNLFHSSLIRKFYHFRPRLPGEAE
jgi:hypothetical protein